MGEFLLTLRLALAALLYLFLVVALYVMWRGLRQNEKTPVRTQIEAQVVFEKGDEEGKRVILRPVTAIGRGATNVLPINDPFASTNHALILWREDLWWLEDLGSHNGTFLNDARISQPAPLTSGDHIRIGETVLRFEITKAAGGE
ncbi:MAG TPA: FHA domain-containing protein [Anaerolineae bacterium]|nr:FHA domain-containing protein [Anaerolineae bacterium]HQI85159.1 FHA domain-containing protein [Anaerolineae bacterium]